ncbi:endonuclease/exonuclease/phosphatase family protein [Pontibacter silvestris]|uniref:Endonuclease/exonuclease/phosphatase family protein n=1 Tax=Pontibacter silvestris TaxID=2305183 RepID=A0ABW4WU73_9BACT|nr:endonuclease/exonuclease/phosphatase family protein [Pontibacter silvestris]MCC9137736.1 endonuclease/exonuclease/phosphatase family protein [Pontibacter silvestris]
MCKYIYKVQSYTMRHGIKTLFLLFTILTLTGCATSTTSSKKGRLHTVAFYNTERLYDINNSPSANDDAFTPSGAMQWDEERYQVKLEHLASVIATMGDKEGPVLIGLSEVENHQVLRDLVNSEALLKNKYGIIHYESEDPQGLDVALLYRPKFFSLTSQENISINFPGASFKSRGILKVKGVLQGEEITVYVNHWPPKYRNSFEGERRLRAAATELRKQIDAQQAVNKDAKIIVMGDFDAEPSANILKDVLNATGRPNPYYNKELFNPFYIYDVQGTGSYLNRGSFEMLDQILISKSLVDGSSLQYVRGSATIHATNEIKFLFGKYKNTPKPTFSGATYMSGYSDHFPVYIKLQNRKRQLQ